MIGVAGGLGYWAIFSVQNNRDAIKSRFDGLVMGFLGLPLHLAAKYIRTYGAEGEPHVGHFLISES